MADGRSHAAVLQERLDVLRVAGGRGRRGAVLSVCGLPGGLVGGVGGSGDLRDEDGDDEGEDDGARSEQEGRARDNGPLQTETRVDPDQNHRTTSGPFKTV